MRDFLAPANPAGQAFELAQAQRALNIVETIVKSQLDHFVVPRTLLLPLVMVRAHAMIAKAAHLISELKTFDGNHTALTGGHCLHRMETKNVKVGQRPHEAPFIAR